MRVELLRAALGLGLTAMASTPALAGPWTQNLGGVYVKVDQGFFVANSYVDASGNVVRGANFFGSTTSVYGEVGLWNGLHLQAYVPYNVSQNTFDDGSQYLNAGGGDLLLALQYSPTLTTPWRLAGRVEFKVPLYDVGGIDGPLAPQFPALGDGQLDVTFWLSGGYGFARTPLYLFLEVGYRHRTEAYVGTGDTRAFGDGLGLAFQVGYTIRQRVLVAANVNVLVPFQKDDWTKGWVSVGPSIFIPIWKGLGVEARFDPVVWARNSARGYGFGIGLSYKRSRPVRR